MDLLHGRRVAIIGSSGRGRESSNFRPGMFERMVERAQEIIETKLKVDNDTSKSKNKSNQSICLVSGGAAWADHVAVVLFLSGKVDRLYLCLPCVFDGRKTRFVDTGNSNWVTNPGGRANQLHREFSRVSGVDSLGDIAKALKTPGCTCSVSRGFLQRNSVIASTADSMIAFTWSRDGALLEGGTKDTWNKFGSKRPKIHVSLASLGAEGSHQPPSDPASNPL